MSLDCQCDPGSITSHPCPCVSKYAGKYCCRAMVDLLNNSDFFSNTENCHQVHEIVSSDIEVKHLLGKGGYCDVKYCIINTPPFKEDGTSYAIKMMKRTVAAHKKRYARGLADLVIEAHFLASFDHPNIGKLHGITAGVTLFNPVSCTIEPTLSQPSQSSCFLILEMIEGTLDERLTKWQNEEFNGGIFRAALKKKRKKRLMDRIKVGLDLAQALEYLHRNKILYRDLKPENIGFDSRGVLKLFDFGLAKELKSKDRVPDGTYRLTGNSGSRRYMAPEVAKKETYNLAADIYSFSILLWELCTTEKPFDGYNHFKHEEEVIMNGFRPKLSKLNMDGNEGTLIRNFLQDGWNANQFHRPSINDTVKILQQVINDQEPSLHSDTASTD